MPSIKEYISEFGNVSFNERAFSDADALALCEVTYMPFESIVSERFSDEPVPFKEAAERLFTARSEKHQKLGLMITAAPSKDMTAMSRLTRFNEMKIVACKGVYCKRPALQFGASTLILPDGTLVVCYRGTNDDIAGWKEDVDLFSHRGTASYTLCVEYIENVAKSFEGDIIVIGHSKGGNVGLYAALNCSEETRKRIKAVYNHDGPGFWNHDLFKTDAYSEILPGYKHYIPSSSFVGVMLAHDYDYKVVKSSKHLGPVQHDLGTWQIENGELVLVSDTDKLSKVTDVFLAKLASRATNEDYRNALDKTLTALTEGTGQKTLSDFAKHIPSSVCGMVKGWKSLDEKTKTDFKGAFSGSVEIIKESISEIKSGISPEEITKNLFNW